MDFDLTEEQKMLQDSLNGFLGQTNDDLTIGKRFDGEITDHADIWTGLCEMGLTAIPLSEEEGGLGMGLLTLAVACESLGYYAANGLFAYHCLAEMALAAGGSDELKGQYIESLLDGSKKATIAWNEEGGLWNPEQWTVAAGDTLSGTKTHVVGADEANVLLVGLAGGKLGLVETAAAGVTVNSANESLDRTRPISTVTFDNAPCTVLDTDLAFANRLRDAALVLHAADAFGASSRCVDMAVEYAKTREQFGRLIGTFQGLQYQLAEIATLVEPSRALYWYAAHAWDEQLDDAERVALLCNAHITDNAVHVGREAAEAHGAIGYTWEFILHVFLKRSMFDRAYLGQPQTLRNKAADLAGW